MNIVLVNGTVSGGLEVLKRLKTNSVHVTKWEQRLSLPANTYHVDERPGCKGCLMDVRS